LRLIYGSSKKEAVIQIITDFWAYDKRSRELFAGVAGQKSGLVLSEASGWVRKGNHRRWN
jgi:hypothetical protein